MSGCQSHQAFLQNTMYACLKYFMIRKVYYLYLSSFIFGPELRPGSKKCVRTGTKLCGIGPGPGKPNPCLTNVWECKYKYGWHCVGLDQVEHYGKPVYAQSQHDPFISWVGNLNPKSTQKLKS